MGDIKFHKTDSKDASVNYLTNVIKEKLAAGKKVFWLVPGGTGIILSTDISRLLKDLPLQNLTVSLGDERYGKVDHPDSNWHQLEKAGFDLPGATLKPVLIDKDIEATTENFALNLEDELKEADYAIGFFGIGADGHTVGILPGSPAVNSDKLAVFYKGSDYTRITLTPRAISMLDEIVVNMTGENKWPVIDKLTEDISYDKQPAQSLKQVPKLTIFNDHKGESV